MAQDVILTTGHETQSAPFTCGAACVNMVLSRWNVQQPQPQVWTEIQNRTGASRPPDARPQQGSFPTQRCDRCSDATTTGPDGTVYGDYHCWFTTPEALAEVVNVWAPVKVGAEYVNDGSAAIRRLADSLASGVPAVFTTAPALHWVVAIGYQIDGPGSPVVWQGKRITALYVRNPTDPDPGDVLRMITIDGLRRSLDGLLMAIECGTNDEPHPIVVKIPTGGVHPAVLVVVGFLGGVLWWLTPWRWRRSRKPQPPGPPPPRFSAVRGASQHVLRGATNWPQP